MPPQHGSIAALSTCAAEAFLHAGKSLTFLVLEERDSVDTWELLSLLPCQFVYFSWSSCKIKFTWKSIRLGTRTHMCVSRKQSAATPEHVSFKFMFQRNDKNTDFSSSHIHSYSRVLTWAELYPWCFELKPLTFTHFASISYWLPVISRILPLWYFSLWQSVPSKHCYF